MRRILLTAVVAGALGALIGLSVVPAVLWAQGGGCWGSICQTAAGTIQFSANVQPTQPIVLSTSPKLTAAMAGDLVLDCQTQSPVAPGAGVIVLRARGGKLVMVVGGSSQEFVIPVLRGGLLDTSPVGFGC